MEKSQITWPADLRIHFKSHSGEKSIDAASVIMHPLEQATLGTTWKRTIEFSSVHSKSLRLLLMIHSGEKSIQCNQCHYVCCDPSALRRHLKTHIGEKTNKCNQCQFASHQVGNLRRHLLNSGEKKDKHCYIPFVVFNMQGDCFAL